MNSVARQADILRAAQSGDHRAFTVLVGSCDEEMRGLAFRLLGSREAMDDALQDAYVKAYRRIGTYLGDAAFSTWMYAVVYRTCLDHLRSRDRRGEVALDGSTEPVAGGVDAADRLAEADALDQALRGLPADQAAVVLLVDAEGLSYREAAQILEVQEGTIASRLHRAHNTLRDVLRIETSEGRTT